MVRSWCAVVLVVAVACVGSAPPSPGEGQTGAMTTTSGDDTGLITPEEDSTGAACLNDADCDDAVFCNGAESCEPGAGCVPGDPPCPEDTCDEPTAACQTDCRVLPDADGDGHDALECGGTDCNDAEPLINPDATETCDARGIDEDCDPLTVGDTDVDGDELISAECCNAEVCGDDCDDQTPGPGLGQWAHCSACGEVCGPQQSCFDGVCAPARRIFATSGMHDGDFGGLAGADAMCQEHADAAGLGGIFRAFMVDERMGLERLEQPEVPFVRTDGAIVAMDWEDLADESIAIPVELDEFGELIEGNAWTGLANVGGDAMGNHCMSWTYNGMGCLKGLSCGAAGESDMVDDHWDGFFVFHCDELYRLYCVEQ